jgi:hypothetical protein
MADIIGDRVFDEGLTILTTDVENLYICTSQPTTFTEASTTYKIGTKATPTITGPTEGGAGGGLQVTVSAISDGVVNSNGDAAWFALTDDSNSELLISGNLGSTQAIVTGSPFSLTTFYIQLQDPTT